MQTRERDKMVATWLDRFFSIYILSPINIRLSKIMYFSLNAGKKISHRSLHRLVALCGIYAKHHD